MIGRWKRRRQARKFKGSPDGVRHAQFGQSQVEIGRLTYGIEHLIVREWGEGASLKIGAFCSIAPVLTVFLGGNHRMDWGSTYPFGMMFPDLLKAAPILGEARPPRNVTIGNDVWIGANVTVMSGVTIGDGAVIGANSTVTRSVGCYEIWGGNPARLIRPRFPDGIARALQSLHWWDWPLETLEQAAPLLCRQPTSEILAQLERLGRQ